MVSEIFGIPLWAVVVFVGSVASLGISYHFTRLGRRVDGGWPEIGVVVSMTGGIAGGIVVMSLGGWMGVIPYLGGLAGLFTYVRELVEWDATELEVAAIQEDVEYGESDEGFLALGHVVVTVVRTACLASLLVGVVGGMLVQGGIGETLIFVIIASPVVLAVLYLLARVYIRRDILGE